MAITIDMPLPTEIANSLREQFQEGIKQNQQDFDNWKEFIEVALPIKEGAKPMFFKKKKKKPIFDCVQVEKYLMDGGVINTANLNEEELALLLEATLKSASEILTLFFKCVPVGELVDKYEYDEQQHMLIRYARNKLWWKRLIVCEAVQLIERISKQKNIMPEWWVPKGSYGIFGRETPFTEIQNIVVCGINNEFKTVAEINYKHKKRKEMEEQNQ